MEKQRLNPFKYIYIYIYAFGPQTMKMMVLSPTNLGYYPWEMQVLGAHGGQYWQ